MWMCQRFGVSRSGFYAWEKRTPRGKNQQDVMLLKHIKKVHRGRRRCYGSPRVYRYLKQKGITCSRRRIARIMRENGIKATVVGLYYYNPKRRDLYQRVENKLATLDAPNGTDQQWVADFTYLKTKRGQWVYLSTIMDLYSRKIIAWSISTNRNADLTLTSLKMAIKRRRPSPGTLFHTDQGIEYAGDRFQEALTEEQLAPSMSGKGSCLDNATMESFFHSFKTESFYQRRFEDMNEIKKEFIKYIDFYNNERLHSSLGYVSPTDYEQCAA